ncbi:hypothetical protein ALC62_14311 [Cyphomyrmex costatus]|uniref:Uncharacterized protein n=1 Tax=Cyphomyrmex costatus TaxID=456900 RepID=A0A151I8S1_9HYME|nr:hypothetical protein ALC62_14311 [Cyphomyrmex costatus]
MYYLVAPSRSGFPPKMHSLQDNPVGKLKWVTLWGIPSQVCHSKTYGFLI